MTITNQNPTTTNETASEVYAARRNDIARLLDIFNTELAKEDERAQAAPQNWGFAGDLAYVRDRLIDAIEFLGGTADLHRGA